MQLRAERKSLVDLGVVLVPIAVLFAARVVCEQTIVPWKHGAPRHGFSVFDTYIDIVGGLLTLLAVAWAIVVLAQIGIRRLRISGGEWTLIALSLVCGAVWMVPNERWMLFSARIHVGGHVPNDWVISAAAIGQLRLLNYLLSSGMDVDTPGRFGESPLSAAAFAGQLEASRLLLIRGARLENRTKVSGETPLIEAAMANQVAVVELLLEHGADPGAKDATGRTALDWARYNHNAGMVNSLQIHGK